MVSSNVPPEVVVRPTRPGDIPAIVALSARVYGFTAWRPEMLQAHLDVFPDGQLVAEEPATGQILGMAASLIIRWDDYEFDNSWRDFTAGGSFTNHDPERGRTLYGAEVMVDPDSQGRGIGKKLYAARRELCQRLRLYRIRAGARLPGYQQYADRMSAEEYAIKVIRGELGDPTLSFQLKQGFRVIAVVGGYLYDPESQGFAAVIEWLNPELAHELPPEEDLPSTRFHRGPTPAAHTP